MEYLIDANILIASARMYYPISVFPSLWDALARLTLSGQIVFIDKVFDELTAKEAYRPEVDWLNMHQVSLLVQDTGSFIQSYQVVVNNVINSNRYSQPAVSEFTEFDRADAWIVTAALNMKQKGLEIAILTNEISTPNAVRRVKIPDVCSKYQINCVNLPRMLMSEGVSF